MKIKKNALSISVIAICAAVMLYFIIRVDGPAVILKAILSAKPVFIICAVVCMLIYWLLEASAFREICRGLKSKISYKDCFHTSMIGQLFNCITPFATGGQPMQAYRLTKCGMPIGQASCALLCKFITYQFVLTIYTAFVILLKFKFFVAEISGFTWLILIGFAANTIVMLAILSIGFFPKLTKKFILGTANLLKKLKLVKDSERLKTKIVSEIDRFYADFEVLKKDPRHFVLPAFLTALQLTAFFSIPYFICLALSVTGLNYLTVICAAAFVMLISSFVPLPGGSGGAEGGFYLFFSIFFLQGNIIGVAVLLWRLITFYLPIFAGMFFTRIKANKLQIKESKTPIKALS